MAIVSAEELFFCEGFMCQGRTFLSLIRSWKSGALAHLPLKNHLIALGCGRAPSSEYFKRRFQEATDDYVQRLLRAEAADEAGSSETRT